MEFLDDAYPPAPEIILVAPPNAPLAKTWALGADSLAKLIDGKLHIFHGASEDRRISMETAVEQYQTIIYVRSFAYLDGKYSAPLREACFACEDGIWRKMAVHRDDHGKYTSDDPQWWTLQTCLTMDVEPKILFTEELPR